MKTVLASPDATTQSIAIPPLRKFTPDQQAVLDRLEEYPAAVFYFPAYTISASLAKIKDLENIGPEFQVSGSSACFTCVAGWTGQGDCTRAKEIHRLGELAGGYESIRPIISWNNFYKSLRAPFNQYDGTAVPKAVVIDAVRRVFSGESVLA